MLGSQTWILRNSTKDLCLFYLPGILAILISKFISGAEGNWTYLLFTWLALGVLDGGHVYSTLWRTYFNKNELLRRPLYYKLAPVLLFLLFALWVYFGGLYLGYVVVYFTIYHNIRQLFGVSKWYQKINKSFDKGSDFFLYAFCLIPVIAFHFRDNVQTPNYYDVSGSLYPDQFLFSLSLLIFSLLFLLYAVKEVIFYFKTKQLQTARILSVIYPGLIYSFAFLFSNNIIEILFPLVVSHGLTYLILIDYSLERTTSNYKKKTLIFVLLAAVVFGSTEFFTESLFVDVSDPTKAIATALFLTPLFCHYLFDAFLWTKDHPESHLIIN